ncbi:MAG: hypothetical protein AAF304_10475, partial [Pseudomonadota bacterium]
MDDTDAFVKETLVIPPNCAMVIYATVKNPMTTDGIFTPNNEFQDKTALLVANAVVPSNTDQTIPVRLINFSNSNITIYKDMRIG